MWAIRCAEYRCRSTVLLSTGFFMRGGNVLKNVVQIWSNSTKPIEPRGSTVSEALPSNGTTNFSSPIRCRDRNLMLNTFTRAVEKVLFRSCVKKDGKKGRTHKHNGLDIENERINLFFWMNQQQILLMRPLSVSRMNQDLLTKRLSIMQETKREIYLLH